MLRYTYIGNVNQNVKVAILSLIVKVTERSVYTGNIHTTGRPTYWPTDRNKIPDVIDFYISKKVPMHYMKNRGFL
jgi:hypothetical protein